MKELTKAIVAMALIGIVVVTGMNHHIDGDLARVGILMIGAIALGADAVTEWLEGRRAESK